MSLFLLGLYHQGTDLLAKALRLSGTLFQAICNRLSGTSNEWYFLPFGFLPASVYPFTHQIEWTYNTYENTLAHARTASRKLNWLSTILHINNREYVLDEWIRTLTIAMEEGANLSPALLVNCWSISHKIWSIADTATLHIIDSDGDSHTIPVDTGSEEWKNLLPYQSIPREEEDEEEEDEEEVEEEETVEEEVVAKDDTELEVEPIFPPKED